MAYDNSVALRQGESCTTNLTITNTGSMSDGTLVKYICTEGTDLITTDSSTYYDSSKSWDHNLAYQK